MNDLGAIVAALNGRPSGGGWLARCPAHDDKTPSLSISESNGKILFHCHAGCSQDAVIAVLRQAGLWSSNGNGNGSARREIARFDYRDADGIVRYQVIRFEPKDFRCYAPASDAWSIKGISPLPYRLPELKAALQRGEPVVIVEGEKDVDSLAALSIVATTNHGGVGNGKVWKDLAKYFPAGSRVILIGDADAPGAKHMHSISALLKARGVEVLWIPPEAMGFEVAEDHGRDVSDWLAGGHTRDELVELLAGAIPAGSAGQVVVDYLTSLVSFRDRQDAEMPPRTWFIDGMITPGFNMLTAKKSQGKSFLLMQIANAIAEGKPFLGRPTTKAKVLFVSFELDECDIHERFAGMERLSENAFLVHAWSDPDHALADAEYAIATLGFKVIIFDTFLPLLPMDGQFKVNEYGDSGLYLGWRRLGKRGGAAILASWHEGKTPRDDFMLNAIGSTGMVAQADCIISIDRKRGDAAGKLFIGGNHAPDSAIPIVFENGIFNLAEGKAAIDRLTPTEERTLAILAKYPEGCTASKVALELGKSDDAARMSLNRLIARVMVTRAKRGVYRTEPNKTEQVPFCSEGTTEPNRTHPLEGCSVSAVPEVTEEEGLSLFEPAEHDDPSLWGAEEAVGLLSARGET